jgi:xanthine dehydrogenase YagR molybdenum-binding subunit
MTTTTAAPTTGAPVIGAGVTRVDGPLKVTEAVPYADDLAPRDALVGVLVGATITSGRVEFVDTSDALAAPGVVAVLSHHGAPRVVRPDEASSGERAVAAVPGRGRALPRRLRRDGRRPDA